MKRLKVATGPSRDLTRAELEIMQILWRKETALVAEIISEMAEPKPAYNTVSTVFRVLEKKGVVAHKTCGKSHRYYPLFDKRTYTRHVMHGVLSNFFDGSFPCMVSFLCEQDNLALQEMEAAGQIIRQRVRTKKKPL